MNLKIRSTQPYAITRFALLGILIGCSAQATELLVSVEGASAPLGHIGCSLFASAEGFPMDNSNARVLWKEARSEGVSCRFDKVPAGTYAISVGHDVNGNRIVDTNFLGIPREQWGVSNNVRPRMRAPRFDEASFEIAEPEDGADNAQVRLTITVAK